jgi:hypothetical protein
MVGLYFKVELHQTPTMPSCKTRNIKTHAAGQGISMSRQLDGLERAIKSIK